jgi:hypothetical protein
MYVKKQELKVMYLYRIQTENRVELIANLTKEIKADLIIMVSEKLGSTIKRHYEQY